MGADSARPLRPRTKIVATLGPATADAESIRRLVDLGVNVFRINMSHGTHDEYREVVQRVRSISDSGKEQVAVLARKVGQLVVEAVAGPVCKRLSEWQRLSLVGGARQPPNSRRISGTRKATLRM